MPELIVYDKRHKRVHLNSKVRYHGNWYIVNALVSTQVIKIKLGGIIETVKSSQVEVLTD